MKLTIYRVLGFLLIPVAILFSIGVLLFIRAALSNPPLLIPVFLATCISIYSFASLNFLIKGIDGKRTLGRSSKDWILVNAIVSIIYALMAIAQRIALFIHPEVIKQVAAQMIQNAGSSSKATPDQIVIFMQGLSYFLLVYGIILLTHILLSFQLMRSYNFLFHNEEQ